MDDAFVERLRPTEETLDIPTDGKCRKWIGLTDDGIAIDLYVTAVRVAERDVKAFESSLGRVLKVRDPATLEDEKYHAPRAHPRGVV